MFSAIQNPGAFENFILNPFCFKKFSDELQKEAVKLFIICGPADQTVISESNVFDKATPIALINTS